MVGFLLYIAMISVIELVDTSRRNIRVNSLVFIACAICSNVVVLDLGEPSQTIITLGEVAQQVVSNSSERITEIPRCTECNSEDIMGLGENTILPEKKFPVEYGKGQDGRIV